MTFRTCSYESELTQAFKSGHWPEGCGPELRAHVKACTNCGDLVLVTQTFQGARSESEQTVLRTSPGLLWWRAQLRRRNAATERVSRPVTIAEIFALVVYVFVGVVLVASQYRHGLKWSSWWAEISPARAFHFLSVGSGQVDSNLLLLIFGFGVLGLVSILVVYFASEKS